MPKTILVPVDFTPVTLHALDYACALRTDADTKVLAVHLLDPRLAGGALTDAHIDNIPLQKVFRHLQADIISKTEEDLGKFVWQLREKWGDAIQPFVTYGTIYESFAPIAAEKETTLLVMGTHGIVGLQHIWGSRAYKVVLHTVRPFIVVQERSPDDVSGPWHLLFRDAAQLAACARSLLELSDCLRGAFTCNVVSGPATLPGVLDPIADRITLISEPVGKGNIISQAAAHGARAAGICIDELENTNSAIYGMSQEKILANAEGMPVLCLR